MWARIHIGTAQKQAEMKRPWAIFSPNGILVRGGPETQVWWVKFRATRALGFCLATARISDVANILPFTNVAVSHERCVKEIQFI